MGSINNGPRLAAFQNDVFAAGLDLGRSVIGADLGVYLANAAATWRAGQILSRNAAGEMILCTGDDPYGVAKWNKVTLGNSVNVDEAVTFTGSGSTVNLLRGNVSNVAVRSAVDQGGTLFVLTTDYTVAAVNGTITHAGGGSAIGVTDTVFVTYTFALTEADMQFQGRNFFNFVDDVSIAENRITVITDWSLLFTIEFDTSLSYTLTGTGSNLYCDANGQFTNDAAAGRFLATNVEPDSIFRSDFGDDESGPFHWEPAGDPRCEDSPGDDEIEISIAANGNVAVARRPGQARTGVAGHLRSRNCPTSAHGGSWSAYRG